MVTVPVMRPRLPLLSELGPRLQSIQDSGVFSNFGGQDSEFRIRIASRLKVSPEQIVLVANATLGIQIAMRCLGGDRWELPSWTFSATAAAACQEKESNQLEFRDVSLADQRISPSRLSSRNIISVAPFGSKISIPSEISEASVVVDAAASIGPSMRHFPTIPDNCAVVFSLHATKVLGIGEGGIVVCGSTDLAHEIRARINFGFDSERVSQALGTNAKLAEIPAAIGNLALDHWDQEEEEWEDARSLANEASMALGLETCFSEEKHVSPYWIVLFETETKRDEAMKVMGRRGVQSRKWWMDGCHKMPAYREIKSSTMDSTDNLAGRYLGLPFFRGISYREVDLVVNLLEEVIR